MSDYVIICINKVANEDWLTAPPFTLNPTAANYALSTSGNFRGFSLREPLAGRLHSIGKIKRTLDILTPISDTANKKITGVGGAATASEFSFSIINVDRDVDVVRLYNKEVKVYSVNDDNILSVLIKTKYTGRISAIERGTYTLNILCKGVLSSMDKEIGSVSDDTDVNKSNIIPIVYGDLTDANSFIPSVRKTSVESANKFAEVPRYYFDTQPLASLNKLKAYDTESKQTYTCVTDVSKAGLDSDNKELNLIDTSKSTLLILPVDADAEIVHLYNPVIVKMFIPIAPSPALTAKVVPNITGSMYLDSASNLFEYVGMVDGLYGFSTDDPDSLGKEGELLTKFDGSGPDTLSVSLRFAADPDFLNDKQFIRQDNTPATPVYIKLDDEILRIMAQVSDPVGLRIVSYRVSRGASGTTAAAHAQYTPAYTSSEIYRESSLVFEHIFWPQAVSSFGSYVGDSSDVNAVMSASFEEAIFTDDVGTKGIAAYTALTKQFDTGTAGASAYIFKRNIVSELGFHKIRRFQIDLVFEIPSISAVVTNAWVLGFYKTHLIDDLTLDSPFGSINIRVGGSVPSKDYQYWKYGVSRSSDPLPDGGAIIPAIERGSLEVGVGMRGDPLAITSVFDLGPTDETQPKIATISNLSGIDQYNNVNAHWTLNGVLQESLKSVDIYSGWLSVNEYTEANKLYSLSNLAQRNFDGSIDPDRHGLTTTLTEFFSRRLFLDFFSAGTYFEIANPGIAVQFEIDFSKQTLYAEGQGRVDYSSTVITDPAYIVQDLIEKEYGEIYFDSDTVAAAAEALVFPSSLILTGNKPNLLKTLDEFAKGNALAISENEVGFVCIDSLMPKAYDDIVNIIDEDDLALSAGTSTLEYTEEYTEIESVITGVDVLYQRNHATSDVYGQKYSSADFTVGASILNTDNRATINSDYVRDSVGAAALSSVLEFYYGTVLRKLTFNVLPDTLLRAGEFIGITSTELGTTGKVCLVVEISEQLFSSTAVKTNKSVTVLVWD